MGNAAWEWPNKKLIEAARIFVDGKLDTQSIQESGAAHGLIVEIEEEPDFEVWPDNWLAIQAVRRLRGQLVAGHDGMGYRPEAVESVLRMMRVPESDVLDTYDAIRIFAVELSKRIT